MKTKKNLTLAAYQAIKEMMMGHHIIPGQRLILTDLAEKLGVSRTPVNNALCILAKEGYLGFIPNQGFSVRCLTREETEDLYETKETLEICTIGKAIRQMTNEKLAQLDKVKKAYEHGIASRVHRKVFVFDAEFHAGIIAMTGNHYMTKRYLEICLMLSLRFRIDDLEINRLEESVLEHNELFETVRIRDVENARVLIKRHNINDRKISLPISFVKVQPPQRLIAINAAT